MENICLLESGLDCDGNCDECPYHFKDRVSEIVWEWKNAAGVKTPILTKYDYSRRKLIIYTTRPGWLVGYHGELYYKYEEMLLPLLRPKFDTQDTNLIEIIECGDYIE